MFMRKTNVLLTASALVLGAALAAPQAVAAPDAPLAAVGVPGPDYPAVPAPQDSTVPGDPAADPATDQSADPRATPPGANDWDCRPTAEHPRPVVLVHGTWGNAYDIWKDMAPELAADGYCVFALNYGEADLATKGGYRSTDPGTYATKDITASSVELADYVDAVLGATGAAKVDLVGHSQGGLLIRHWLKYHGGAEKAQKVVTLGATNHGTTMNGLGTLDRQIGGYGVDLDPALDYIVGEAGVQQIYGSPLLEDLNADGDTVPGIDYTVIGTRYDTTSTPYEATFLTAGPGATVDNITLQDGCEIDRSPHGMTASPRVIDLVRNALTPGSVPEPRCVAVGEE
jgi:triacylglycerol lipase